jgi:hypothetical protein
MFNNFYPSNLAVYELMWENIEFDKPQTTIQQGACA